MGQNSRWLMLVLIAANLVPVAMVLWNDWTVIDVLLLFWLENIIIGAYNVLKMASCQPLSVAAWGARLFMTPFFTVHYGMFALGHGLALVALFDGPANAPDFSPEFVPWVITHYGLAMPALMLVLSHGVFFVHDYLIGGGYRVENPATLMFKPYGRVVILHIGIFLMAFALLALGEPLSGLLLMIVLKIVVDLLLLRRGDGRTDLALQQPLPSMRDVTQRFRAHYAGLMQRAEVSAADPAVKSPATQKEVD